MTVISMVVGYYCVTHSQIKTATRNLTKLSLLYITAPCLLSYGLGGEMGRGATSSYVIGVAFIPASV
ncbi:MAG TPA: hypothetical protein V6D12_09730 [Candidatus Obscuribacterales bacterium]